MTGLPNIEKQSIESLSSEAIKLKIIQIRRQRAKASEDERNRHIALNAEAIEKKRCEDSFVNFVEKYVQIYDSVDKQWISFDLWDSQKPVAEDFITQKKIIVLKARQLGLTWLCLAYALWRAIFHPIQNILLFSLRETEARVLLSDERLEGMFKRLPIWMRPQIITNSGQEFTLLNGSSIKAFPTTAGDSYSATLVIVDEADLVPNLNALLRRADPTVEDGGQIFLVSRSDKDHPMSDFKQIYRAALAGEGGYHPIFLSWNARPDRTLDWYELKKAETLKNTGSLDNVYEQYPATPAQSLAAKELNARIPPRWIEKVYKAMSPLTDDDIQGAIDLPNLQIYKLPEAGKIYFAGCDPAGGLEANESATKKRRIDDSAISIMDEDGEECALLFGKYEPSVTASYLAQLCTFYNGAEAMILRRNVCNSVILKIREMYPEIEIMYAPDKKAGWDESEKGKMIMYSRIAEDCRDGNVIIHSSMVSTQLTSIEAATLKAPTGMHDDCADSFTACNLGRTRSVKTSSDDVSSFTSILMM